MVAESIVGEFLCISWIAGHVDLICGLYLTNRPSVLSLEDISYRSVFSAGA